MNRASRLFDRFNVLFMILVVLATFYPLWYVAAISFSDGNAVLRGEVNLWPVDFTLESYRLVFRDPLTVRSLLNSVFYTTLGTAINLFVTALCAYVLARPRFSGRKFFTWVVTITMFFSGGLIPLYLVVLKLGLQNTMWSFLLCDAMNVWWMFILRTQFQAIHPEIYDAALTDGASEFQTFARVVLPLAKPVLATLLLFYAVGHWNSWFYPLMFLDDAAKYPIQLILRKVVLLGRFDETHEMDASVDYAVVERTLKYATIMVAVVPILGVYPFVQRYFTKGVRVGAIKG